LVLIAKVVVNPTATTTAPVLNININERLNWVMSDVNKI